MRRYLLLLTATSLLLFSSCITRSQDDVYIPIGNSSESSIELLEKQYGKRPDSLRVGYDYAYALAALERYSEAAAVLSSLETLHGPSLRLLYLESYVNEKAGYDNIETLMKIYELDRGDTENQKKIAAYHIENGEDEIARAFLMDVLRRSPKDNGTLELLSRIDPFYLTLYVPEPEKKAEEKTDTVEEEEKSGPESALEIVDSGSETKEEVSQESPSI